MKAMRIHAHGGPEAMAFEDIEIAPAPRGHVRVRHTAIALNFSDINVRRGGFYQKEPMAMPLIPGNEAAGVVASVGEDVTQWKPGDRVAYAGMHGPSIATQAPMRRSATCPPTGLSRSPMMCRTRSPAACC